jgi:hypothetical protein
LDIFQEVQRQGGRCFILRALEGRQKVVAQGSARARARTRPWVSIPANSSPLPPNRPPLGEFGGRGGERGLCPLHLSIPLRSPNECLVGTKREVCETVEPSPLTLAPNTNSLFREREQIAGTLTQGGTSGDSGPELLPLIPPGYRLMPRWGSIRAAFCRFTNAQSPASP